MDACKLTRKHSVRQRVIYPRVSCGQNNFALFRQSLLLLILMLFITASSHAANSKVLIIKSSSQPIYEKVIREAKRSLKRYCSSNKKSCKKPTISVHEVNKNIEALVRKHQWELIVTIGTKASDIIRKLDIQIPVLNSLVPSNYYWKIKSKKTNRHTSAIFIDQPIKRQLRLIKAAIPNRKKVGVLLGKYSGINKNHLQQAIRKSGLQPVIVNASSKLIGSYLERIFPKIDVLLALPDPSIHNKQTVMKILLSSYRHRVPVIGYSSAYVRSGASIAVYSSPKDIGSHIGEEIGRFYSSNSKTLSAPAYPAYYSVRKNNKVINSLKIRMPSSKKIKSIMMRESE